MARGKGGLASNVVLVTTRRRATSVPVEPATLTSYTPASYRRAQHVTNNCMDDADALSTASKRHDRRLLDNISNRLQKMEMDNVKPGSDVAMVTGFRRYLYGAPRPPLEKEAMKKKRKDELMYPWDYTRDNFYRRSRTKKSDEDEASVSGGGGGLGEAVEASARRRHDDMSAVQWPVGMYDDIETAARVAKLKARSMSALPTASAVSSRGRYDDYNNYDYNPGAKSVRAYCPSYVPEYDKESFLRSSDVNRKLLDSHVAVDAFERLIDVTFKRKPTFHYSTPTVALTTEQDGCDADETRINNWLSGRKADYLRPYIPERPSYLATKVKSYRAASEPPKRRDNCLHAGQAVRRAREALGRVERETGVSGYDVDYEDYDEPSVIPARVQPVRSAARTGFVRGSVPTAVRSHGRPPLPTSYSAIPRSQRLAQIEARLSMQSAYDGDGYVSPVASYGQLRNQTHLARDKMDTHKVLLDRYLPINFGPENEVEQEVLYKYSELADRMPSLQPRQRRHSVDRASSVPPYRPSSAPVRPAGGGGGGGYANDSMRRPAFTPTMSDTRKRCREVLCRTKHDPRYFDY